MKLYIYEHCPYCVRAMMPFGLKGIPVEIEHLLNDDEETPIGMTGVKALPILEDHDGPMGESLDIVERVDKAHGEPLFSTPPRSEILDWIKKWGPTMGNLVMPRTPDAAYPEFETQAARDYFTNKKEKTPGEFGALLAATASFVAEIEKGLAELVPILPDPEGASMDDIHLFPHLRSLSRVPGLSLPAPVAAYRERMAERSGVRLIDPS